MDAEEIFLKFGFVYSGFDELRRGGLEFLKVSFVKEF